MMVDLAESGPPRTRSRGRVRVRARGALSAPARRNGAELGGLAGIAGARTTSAGIGSGRPVSDARTHAPARPAGRRMWGTRSSRRPAPNDNAALQAILARPGRRLHHRARAARTACAHRRTAHRGRREDQATARPGVHLAPAGWRHSAAHLDGFPRRWRPPLRGGRPAGAAGACRIRRRRPQRAPRPWPDVVSSGRPEARVVAAEATWPGYMPAAVLSIGGAGA